MRNCPRGQHGPPGSDCTECCLSLSKPSSLQDKYTHVLLWGVQQKALLYGFCCNLHVWHSKGSSTQKQTRGPKTNDQTNKINVQM